MNHQIPDTLIYILSISSAGQEKDIVIERHVCDIQRQRRVVPCRTGNSVVSALKILQFVRIRKATAVRAESICAGTVCRNSKLRTKLRII